VGEVPHPGKNEWTAAQAMVRIRRIIVLGPGDKMVFEQLPLPLPGAVGLRLEFAQSMADEDELGSSAAGKLRNRPRCRPREQNEPVPWRLFGIWIE
jgi:hypothetical protein